MESLNSSWVAHQKRAYVCRLSFTSLVSPVTGERVVLGNFVNGLDAESGKLCDLAGVNSREFQDAFVGKRRIAVVKELAGDRVTALRSRSDSRSLRHPEDTKLRPKHRWKLGLQLFDAPSQVPNSEETMYIYCTALIDVIPVHVS